MGGSVKREQLLDRTIEHIDITAFDARPLIEAYGRMALQARNLARAAKIYETMLRDPGCTIILCLAGSLFSAGLKKVVHTLVAHNMVDVLVASGAIIVDQDFFEALGFRHYAAQGEVDDATLRTLEIDRIYDTYIDEGDLRTCDRTVAEVADGLPPQPHSSREFIRALGAYLEAQERGEDSVVREASRRGVPIFVPAFSDCSAGFGLIAHQRERGSAPHVTIDSVKDFAELTALKVQSEDTGLLMVGGGVPKNFAQDVTVAAHILGEDAAMHKYAVQITVADERDGGLSGSTLREAHSWGKVDEGATQMVFAEATLALPLLASYAYHTGGWETRTVRNFNRVLEETPP